MTALVHEAASQRHEPGDTLARLVHASSSHCLSSTTSNASLQRLPSDACTSVPEEGDAGCIDQLAPAPCSSSSEASPPSGAAAHTETVTTRGAASAQGLLQQQLATPAVARSPGSSCMVGLCPLSSRSQLERSGGEPSPGSRAKPGCSSGGGASCSGGARDKDEFVRRWVRSQQLLAGVPRRVHYGGFAGSTARAAPQPTQPLRTAAPLHPQLALPPTAQAPAHVSLPPSPPPPPPPSAESPHARRAHAGGARAAAQPPPLPSDVQEALHQYWRLQQRSARARTAAWRSRAVLLAAGAAAAAQSLMRKWSGTSTLLAGWVLLAAGHALMRKADGDGDGAPSDETRGAQSGGSAGGGALGASGGVMAAAAASAVAVIAAARAPLLLMA